MKNLSIENQGMLKMLEHLYTLLEDGKQIPFHCIRDKIGIESKYWVKLINGGIIERLGFPSKPLYRWVSIKPNIYMANETLKDVSDYTDIDKEKETIVKSYLKDDIISRAELLFPYENNNMAQFQNDQNKKNIVKKSEQFIKPTIDQISLYCSIRNNGINPNQFYDYYQSNGWKVGGAKMKDWMSAIRYWERRKTMPVINKFKELRDYTTEELLAELKRRGGSGSLVFSKQYDV
jgi:hypothetical protein